VCLSSGNCPTLLVGQIFCFGWWALCSFLLHHLFVAISHCCLGSVFGEVVLVGGFVFPGVFLAAMQPLFSLLLHSSFQFGVSI